MTVLNPPIFLQAGSYPAEDVRRLLSALIQQKGVFAAGDLAVTENATPNMTLNVASGRVAIAGSEATYQGMYVCDNRGVEVVTIATAHATLARKDLVVAKVQDAVYSGAVNSWSIVVVTGTAAASPAEPALPNNCIVLAMVDVPAADIAITNSQITDRRLATAGQGIATANGGIIHIGSYNTGIPSSPYEGMMVYDRSTDNYLAYSTQANSGTGGWVVLVGPGAWTAYDPGLGCSVGGSGFNWTSTRAGRFKRVGSTVFAQFTCKMVSGSNPGGGYTTTGFPPGCTPLASPFAPIGIVVGHGIFIKAAATALYNGITVCVGYLGASNGTYLRDDPTQLLGGNQPLNTTAMCAVDNVLSCQLMYEAEQNSIMYSNG